MKVRSIATISSLPSLVFATFLAANAPEAHATASAFAQTTVDWSSLSVTAPTGSTFGELSSFSEADTTVFTGLSDPGTTVPGSGDPQSDSSTDWGNTSLNGSQTGATGIGSTTSGQLQTTGNVSVSGQNNAAEGGGHVIRNGVLTVAADGLVTISFNYEMELVLSTSENGENAFGFTEIQTAFIPVGPTGGGVSARPIGPKTVSNGSDFNDTQSGSFSFSQNFLAGQQLGFEVDIRAFARAEAAINFDDDDEVPEPSTALLLLSGLVLLKLPRFRRASGHSAAVTAGRS